ncbi:hypothetical protein EDC04DRAFT_2558214 [Pisolithus marmoratus]|nr:hypothetical protein EDC04DRAFT_2558214 [Pisolithus marmoratus]
MPTLRQSYHNALTSLSARTGTPLPSLVLSFAVLHELTAIIPLAGIFFASRQLGFGERVVGQFIRSDTPRDEPSWLNDHLSQWVDEGERWAERVGYRYGIFGFAKGQPLVATDRQASRVIAGDVANAVFAYGIVKALLPVRIGLSLYLSPSFSRRVLDPIRLRVSRLFRKS